MLTVFTSARVLRTASSFTSSEQQPFSQRSSCVIRQKLDDSSVSVPRAQDALVSPSMARDLRRIRSNRGRAEGNKRRKQTGSGNSDRVELFTAEKGATDTPEFLRRKVTTTKDANDLCSIRRTNSMDLPYESAIEALRTYYLIHGDLAMPRRYVVPANGYYPSEWVGLDLAASVYNMKWWKKNISNEKTDRVNELNKLGFLWERLQPEWNIVLQALVTYHSLHGDVLVASKFVVPHGYPQWPKATWGIPLGNCVYRIRARNDFLHDTNAGSRRNQLESLGFVWDVHEHRFLKFFAVLRHFARLEGCGKFSTSGRPKPLRVPSNFVVPENDDRWPKELWNFPLGTKCTAVRQKELYVKNNPRRQQMLEDLGFWWSGNADLSWLKVVHAAAIYSKLHYRNLDVPYKFVVPEPPLDLARSGEDWPWPEHLWGLPLGQRLKEIRITGAYLKDENSEARRRQLDALGFIWDVREHRFLKFYAALQQFAQLYQCGRFSCKHAMKPLHVPSTFVVPTDDVAWPRDLWKFNLGKTASAVRVQGLYVKNHWDRKRKLEVLGFIIEDMTSELQRPKRGRPRKVPLGSSC